MEEVPKGFNVADYILKRADELAEKTAYICGDQKITYGKLKQKVNQTGLALKDDGVEMENRVLLLMKDTPDLPIAFLGADRKSTRLNSSHIPLARMPASA